MRYAPQQLSRRRSWDTTNSRQYLIGQANPLNGRIQDPRPRRSRKCIWRAARGLSRMSFYWAHPHTRRIVVPDILGHQSSMHDSNASATRVRRDSKSLSKAILKVTVRHTSYTIRVYQKMCTVGSSSVALNGEQALPLTGNPKQARAAFTKVLRRRAGKICWFDVERLLIYKIIVEWSSRRRVLVRCGRDLVGPLSKTLRHDCASGLVWVYA